jgi:flagella basal body P-ring formation protein FlgA
MDSRVQLQGCSLALVMDLPFSSRETVRVRCMGNPTWQLYLRLLFKPGAVALANSRPAVSGPSGSSGPSALSTPSGSNPASPKRQIVVGKQLLRAGSVLGVDLLLEQEHVGPGLDPLAVVSIKDVLNGEMVRDVAAGVPLRSHDVRRALLVKMGQSVVLTISQGSGFSITARVEALQDGRIGDQVRLRNPDSGRILSGVVTGPSAVRGL